jgi:hypothetical protein
MEARPWKDGKTVTYRYHPIGGKPVNLGTDKQAAIEQVLRLNRAAPDSGTLAEMWRVYLTTHDWLDLKPGTQADYRLCWTQLEPRFGSMTPAAIKALHVRRYLRSERAEAPVRANREMALLSNLLNVAIDQGECEINVCRHVRRNKERPRRVAPEPQTLLRFVSWAWARGGQAAVLSGMAEFAARSGNRRIEFRELHWPQVADDHIRLRRAKQRDDDAPAVEVVSISPGTGSLAAAHARHQRRHCGGACVSISQGRRVQGACLQDGLGTPDARSDGCDGGASGAAGRPALQLPRPASVLHHRAQAAARRTAGPAQEPRHDGPGL